MKYTKKEIILNKKFTDCLVGLLVILIIIFSIIFLKSKSLDNEFTINNKQMQFEIEQIKNILEKNIIGEVDKLEIKNLFENDNNQLTYIIINERSDYGENILQYPEHIKGEYFNNSTGYSVTNDTVEYYLEIGVDKSANINNAKTYYVFTYIIFIICWLIGTFISIIKIYRVGGINLTWIITSLLTSMLSYYIYKILKSRANKTY